MTGIDPHAAAPASPAGRDPLFDTRRPGAPRIPLRPSLALHFALASGAGVAAAAVWTALAPWLGIWRALPLVLAFVAACGLSAAAWRRTQPAVIEIGPDSFAAYSREGVRLLEGRLTGAAQWGGSLLALAVKAGARRATVLVAADAVGREAFRALAVRARCAAGR
ncbi:protein YgfX [Paraburkholderia ferrariae]|uniref:protein YgfX n=1 Tax=Paraburkholderia ferrariae TaxID=386056 RepID=UPI00069439A9|nr:protein YgfX [Paraburkholderia ferrariae]